MMSACCLSAWPMPARLPWPKIPSVPAKNGVRTPSRSTFWAAKKRTSAWATVARTGSCGWALIERAPHMTNQWRLQRSTSSGDLPRDERLEVGERRHVVGARELGGDVGAGGVGQPQRALQVVVVEQPVHERAAERVAGAEAVDDAEVRHRRYFDNVVLGPGQHAGGTLLDDRDLHA